MDLRIECSLALNLYGQFHSYGSRRLLKEFVSLSQLRYFLRSQVSGSWSSQTNLRHLCIPGSNTSSFCPNKTHKSLRCSDDPNNNYQEWISYQLLEDLKFIWKCYSVIIFNLNNFHSPALTSDFMSDLSHQAIPSLSQCLKKIILLFNFSSSFIDEHLLAHAYLSLRTNRYTPLKLHITTFYCLTSFTHVVEAHQIYRFPITG